MSNYKTCISSISTPLLNHETGSSYEGGGRALWVFQGGGIYFFEIKGHFKRKERLVQRRPGGGGVLTLQTTGVRGHAAVQGPIFRIE